MSTEEKTKHIVDFLLPLLQQHSPAVSSSSSPFVIGLSGPQGCGKSTLVRHLATVLSSAPYNYRTAQLSLDDLYLTHKDQTALSARYPDNRLLRKRGQPGTHDLDLAQKTFSQFKGDGNSLSPGSAIRIPFYDKSQHSGQGDRAPEEQWVTIEGPVDVVIFEGWCVGFQAHADDELESIYQAKLSNYGTAVTVEDPRFPVSTLEKHSLSHIQYMNSRLREYNAAFMGPTHFNALVFMDVESVFHVYKWRLEQEENLKKVSGGAGMTDEEVINFVKGYMPGYELYLGKLREGFFNEPGKQLQLLLGGNREIVSKRVL